MRWGEYQRRIVEQLWDFVALSALQGRGLKFCLHEPISVLPISVYRKWKQTVITEEPREQHPALEGRQDSS